MIYARWKEPACPWCGSKKPASIFFANRLTTGEKICGFCLCHYWQRGWRNLPDNPVKIAPRPVWFLLPYWNERGVVIFVLAFFATLLIFLGKLVELAVLFVFGKVVIEGLLFLILSGITCQFVVNKWRQQLFFWQVEANVVGKSNHTVTVGAFKQVDKKDPRNYFLAIVLGRASNRWSDVVIVKDIVTGEYKKILLEKVEKKEDVCRL
jgi:hypothetical protein